jgi:hypothetical protein
MHIAMCIQGVERLEQVESHTSLPLCIHNYIHRDPTFSNVLPNMSYEPTSCAPAHVPHPNLLLDPAITALEAPNTKHTPPNKPTPPNRTNTHPLSQI